MKEDSTHIGDPARPPPRILIIGAGISGLCLAIRLRLAGIATFTLLEKSADVGGTWLDNAYPNAGCDIPSFLYSFSFAPKHDWTRKFARQPEILAYLHDCVHRFHLRPHIVLQTGVTEARYDEARRVWVVSTDRGDEREAEILVSAVGQLNRPSYPMIDGIDSFKGTAFHSARWDPSFDPSGKTVAVIGNGASAVQFLPQLAAAAAKTIVFQRTANWISPLQNRDYSKPAAWAFRRLPGLARLYRMWLFLSLESRFIIFRGSNPIARFYAARLRRRMRRQIPRELRATLTPDFPPGCKRILLSSDYLQTLQRKNVELVSNPILRVTPTGPVTAAAAYAVDAIIYATGFESHRFLSPINVVGRRGLRLSDAWQVRPRTYLGLMTAGFPNLFMLYGPNTNLGHNSIVFMIECQVDVIVRSVKAVMRGNAAEIEVPTDCVERFDRSLQAGLKQTVWAGDCTSWYKSADGSIVNNWSSTATAYWWRTRAVDPRRWIKRRG